jgi:uncharacterized protein (DUF1778 family)
MKPTPKPRHRKPDSTPTIRVRVSVEQRRVLTEAAEVAGLDLSSWVRSVALREARSGR